MSVTQLKPKKDTWEDQVLNADQVMRKIRLELYSWDTMSVARQVGVTTGCIYAIRRGKTKWPRGDTFFALCKVLGFQIILRKV